MSEDNPLTARLIGKPAELPTAYWLMLGVSVSCAVIMAVLVSNVYYSSRVWGLFTQAVFWLLVGIHIFVPLIVSLVAVLLTGRDVQSEDYQLLCATLVPDEKFVSGYITATFYKLRYLLLVLAMAGAALTTGFMTSGFFLGLLVFPFAVASWGFVQLAAALGVEASLKNYRFWLPIITTPLLLFFGGVFFLFGMFIMGLISFGILLFVVMFVPFWLASNVRTRASRWVRHT
jgi:hypothetical protein